MSVPESKRLPIIEIFGVMTIALGMLLVVWLMLNFTRPGSQPVGMVTAVFTVIPAPSATPHLPTPTLEPTARPDAPPGPDAGVLGIGNYVQISGTGGDGLRIRQGPGLNYEQLFLGLEAEVFEIVDGPLTADGYTWWHLSAPYDASIHGWAVSNYLVVVDSP